MRSQEGIISRNLEHDLLRSDLNEELAPSIPSCEPSTSAFTYEDLLSTEMTSMPVDFEPSTYLGLPNLPKHIILRILKDAQVPLVSIFGASRLGTRIESTQTELPTPAKKRKMILTEQVSCQSCGGKIGSVTITRSPPSSMETDAGEKEKQLEFTCHHCQHECGSKTLGTHSKSEETKIGVLVGMEDSDMQEMQKRLAELEEKYLAKELPPDDSTRPSSKPHTDKPDNEGSLYNLRPRK